jgi:hypothetical protein
VTPAALQALLLDCIHLDRSRLDPAVIKSLDASDWDALVALSIAHGVFTQVHTRLSEPGLVSWVPTTALDRLRQAKLSNVVRNMRISQQLRELLAAFDKAGLPVIVLKGAYLAEHVYENRAQRFMLDIDLLVLPDTLRAVQVLLQDLGYHGQLKALTPLDNECPFGRPGAPATVDLHWNLTYAVKEPSIDDASLWERSESVQFEGSPAKVLSPEDLLLHLCMHASYHHEFGGGLRMVLDVAVLCNRVGQALDWGTVVRQAAAWRWDRGTYLCLLLARDMLGAPVPEAVLADLSRYIPSPPTELAMELVLSGADKSVSVPKALHLHALAQGYGPVAALRMVLTRLRRITRHEIESRYGVSETTPWLPAYYLRCVWDLTRRNYRTLGQIAVGDAQIRGDIDRAMIIKGFLGGDSTSR